MGRLTPQWGTPKPLPPVTPQYGTSTTPYLKRALQPDWAAPTPAAAGYTERWMPSSPLQMRDATYDRLKLLPPFDGRVHKILTYPTIDAELPVLCIAFGSDRASSEGEGNQGPPHFIHAFTLVISIIDAAESAWVLDASVMDKAEQMRAMLLTDPTWVNVSEGIDGIVTDVRYPQPGASPLCEVRTQITMRTRSWWEPMPQPPFMEIDIRRQISDTEMDGAPPDVWGPENVLEDDILLNNYDARPEQFNVVSSLSCDAEVI
jgi:hypothetical protein